MSPRASEEGCAWGTVSDAAEGRWGSQRDNSAKRRLCFCQKEGPLLLLAANETNETLTGGRLGQARIWRADKTPKTSTLEDHVYSGQHSNLKQSFKQVSFLNIKATSGLDGGKKRKHQKWSNNLVPKMFSKDLISARVCLPLMAVCHVQAQRQQSQQRVPGPQTWSYRCLWAVLGVLGSEPGLLQEQWVPLVTELSLLPLTLKQINRILGFSLLVFNII